MEDRLSQLPEKSMEDRLSQLPNDLLIRIISSTLTLKEAATTSILSKRWKTVWTYYYGFLDFDDDCKLRLQISYSGSNYKLFEECTSKYIDYVNKVLNSHQGFSVDKLRICWRLRNESKNVIDSWIDFAMKKRVQHFELDLCLPAWSISHYKFPHDFFFPNLTNLQLNSVDLTDEDLAHFLCSKKCPLLQHISVKSVPSLEHVKVVGNSKLKSMEFDECWEIKYVEISSAVNMELFGFRGPENTKITFEDVPLLTKALFGGDYCKNVAMIPTGQQLWSVLSQLEVLVLDLIPMPRFELLERISQIFPKFDRLKHLEVHSHTRRLEDLNEYIMAMIYCCPQLQKFSLNKYYNIKGGSATWRRFAHQEIHYEHRHKCLQTVEYIGWIGYETDLELIANILNNSVVLDKVTIDPRTKFLSKEDELEVTCYDEEFVSRGKKREEGARKAAEKLRTSLPERVTLIVL